MQHKHVAFYRRALHTPHMSRGDIDELRVLSLQTRVNKEENDLIRAAMRKDRAGPTGWIRDVLLTVARMTADDRQELVELDEEEED